MSDSKSIDTSAARNVIISIWHRARINAFAHKLASEIFAAKAKRMFLIGLVCAILSILFVILVYLMNNSSTDGRAAQKLTALLGFDHEITALLFTLFSIITALASIVLTVLASTGRYDILATEHSFFNNSYQYIAQRAREVNWPNKPDVEILELLKDLERDFQILKVRGRDPDDSCYEKANELFKKIRNDKDTQATQSFRPEEEEH